MGWWGWSKRRFEVLLKKKEVERELDEEMRFHLEMEIRQHLASGLSPDEARRRALVAFGGVERYKEAVRDVRGARLLDDFLQDVRVALRSLPKQPEFLVTVLVTLAIGIGGNVAMFGVLDATLLHPLPYPDADRLVLGRVTYEGVIGSAVSGPDYFDYKEQSEDLASLSALTPFPIQATVTGMGAPERVLAPLVSPDLFRTLGVEPLLGRHFRDEEGEPGGDAVVMVSHDYWQRSLGGDPNVVGMSLDLDDTSLTVVGVMPPGFHFLEDADLWRPMVRGGRFAESRQFHNWVLVGRLAPGTNLSTAQAKVDVISDRLEEAYPDSNADKGLHLTPLQDALLEGYRTTLALLTAAVVVLLLVAGTNVAGLLVARGTSRKAEMAMRAVVGAGRGRLGRQLIAENALLAVSATVLGVGLATWLERGILSFVPFDSLGPIEAHLSPRMLVAAVGLAVLTLLVFGVAPALRLASSDSAEALRSSARTAGSRSSTWARNALVVTQVALTTVLLVAAGLLVRSFREIRSVDPGFDTSRLLTARVPLPPNKYEDVGRRLRLFNELQTRVGHTPGVQAVGLISHMPVRETGDNVRVAPPDEWESTGAFGNIAYRRIVLPGTFDALGIPVIAGRDFVQGDQRGGRRVIVLSESLASGLFAGGSALGRMVRVDADEQEPALYEVVGVVGDVIPNRLTEESAFAMYFAYGQRAPLSMTLAVRSATDGAGLASALKRVLGELDPEVPLSGVQTMDEILRLSVSEQRSVTVLLISFAVMALLLASVGLYGVIAYQVSRRLHEIGIRMAVGASATAVSRKVLQDGLSLVMVGLLLGVPGGFVASRLIRGMLYGVSASDPVTYIGVAALLVAVGGVACLVPARQAAHVDPVQAFQAD